MNDTIKKIFNIKGDLKYETIQTNLNPFEIFKKMYFFNRDIFIFESLEGPKEFVRSSIIGFNPKYTINCLSKKITIYKNDKVIDTISTIDPFETIKKIFKKTNVNENSYVGGLVGYISYEAIKYWEKINVKTNRNFPLMEFGVFTDGIVYDHQKNKVEYFFYEKSNLDKVNKLIKLKKNNLIDNSFEIKNLNRNIEKTTFKHKVQRVKRYLKNGEIFQAVISKKISFDFEGDPLFLYQALRKINPSPYMFFYKINSRILLGSSPEMLLRISNKKVETYPIAGSRPVSQDAKITEKLRIEMLKDKKEIAEHTMLVDLARNDIGKVCKFGTVITDELMTIKQFSHIQHIVSHVYGTLKEGYSVFDAFKAVFPAGTLTGAPKIRAMEIINELEPESRGPYAGAIGYFSFNHTCDFAITIRSIFINKRKGYNQSGAGIVIDSDPESEYNETEHKSDAILSTLKSLQINKNKLSK